MKKHLTLAALATGACLLLGAAIASAQPWQRHGGMGMRGGANMLATALNLSDSQKTAVEQLHSALLTKVQPLFEQHRQQMAEIHGLLDAGNADAATIGQKVIAAYATGQKIKAAHDDFDTKVSALLDSDQLTKFKALQSMRKQFMGGHGFGMMTPPDAQ